MSVQGSSGIADTRKIEFAQPTALNTAVIGKDQESGLSFFNAVSGNIMLRMVADYADGLDYEIDLVRDGKTTRMIEGSMLSSKLPGPIWYPFPYIVNPGIFQIQARQTKGALTALTVSIIYDHPLGQ